VGIFLFYTKVLMEYLEENSRRENSHDFGRDILPQIIGKIKVHGYRGFVVIGVMWGLYSLAGKLTWI